jgi:hypothetical protein
MLWKRHKTIAISAIEFYVIDAAKDIEINP